MANPFWKGIAFAPFVPGSPHQDFTVGVNPYINWDTGSMVVRFWADWPTCQPNGPNQFDMNYIGLLDQQITRAHDQGLFVILTAHRFPRWANGTSAINDRNWSDPNFRASIYDRMSRTSQDPATINWADATQWPLKDLEFRVPGDLSLNSDWGKWIQFLVNRYSYASPNKPGPNCYINMLEVCNEPNAQMWPQQASSTTSDPWAEAGLTIQCPIGDMFQTALTIASWYGGNPYLLGPGSADYFNTTFTSRMGTDPVTFAGKLVDQVNGSGFPAAGTFAWSHHSYQDILRQRWGPSAGGPTNQAQRVRAALTTHGWKGYPDTNPANAGLWLTEGGAERGQIVSVYGGQAGFNLDNSQAYLIWVAGQALRNSANGTGIYLWTNYLTYDNDARFQSGLLLPYSDPAVQRPHYQYFKNT